MIPHLSYPSSKPGAKWQVTSCSTATLEPSSHHSPKKPWDLALCATTIPAPCPCRFSQPGLQTREHSQARRSRYRSTALPSMGYNPTPAHPAQHRVAACTASPFSTTPWAFHTNVLHPDDVTQLLTSHKESV